MFFDFSWVFFIYLVLNFKKGVIVGLEDIVEFECLWDGCFGGEELKYFYVVIE